MTSDSTRPDPAARVVDGMFEVDGGSMHLHCTGTGSPTVVFDSALGQGGTAWSKIAPAVARSTRTCVYDRKGVAYSDAPVSKPHTPRQMADEIHSLLARASIAGPYVLVGHSIGGITMQLFASAHPDEVSGMVLVEAADDPAPLWDLMPPQAVAERRKELDNSPEGLDFDAFVAGAKDMHASTRPLGDKPLVILTRGKPDAPPTASADVAERWLAVWNEQQARLLSLSSNVAHVVAPNSGHMMPVEAPALVLAAVHHVVAAVRAHARVHDDALLPFARTSTTLNGS